MRNCLLFLIASLGAHATDTACVPLETAADELTLLQGVSKVKKHTQATQQPLPVQPLSDLFKEPVELPEFTDPTEHTGAPVNSSTNFLHRRMLDYSTYGSIGGRCLDGSMAGYYYGRPAELPSTLWVINMMGGGMCVDQATCQTEYATVGSEYHTNGVPNGVLKWEEARTPVASVEGHILSTVQSKNPDFRNAHHVHIPYCTEDTHAGRVVTPTDGCAVGDDDCVDQWGMYFSGHLNFKNILHHILSHELASRSMTQVLFTGTSAGAKGVYHNCDFLQSFLNDFFGTDVVQVSCAGVGGWFLPGYTDDHEEVLDQPSNFADFAGNVSSDGRPLSMYMAALYDMYLPPECSSLFPDEPWRCATVTALYPSIVRPVYVIQTFFDMNWLSAQLGMPKSRYDTCTGSQFIAYVGRAMKNTANSVNKKSADGWWLASCLDHTTGIKFGHTVRVQGYNSLEAIGNWFRGADGFSRILVDDCQNSWEGPCNPTCDDYYNFNNHERAQLDFCSECVTLFEEQCSMDDVGQRRECAENNREQLIEAGCTLDVAETLVQWR